MDLKQTADRDDVTFPMMTQIEELVRDVPGWTPLDQLHTLFTVAFLTSGLEGDIVEVGSWCGRSAVVLGHAARLAGKSRVVCVDLFPEKKDWRQNPDGSYSFEVMIDGKRYGGYEEQTVWKEAFETQTGRIYERYEGVFDCFRETVAARGLQEVIHAHKGDCASMLAAAGPGFKCRLAFLDGDHGYDASSSDIRNIDQCLVPGGWLCFDDAFTVYQGVNRAISELVLQNPRYERCQQMTRKLFIARKKANCE
jgi:predicted O-methyltransferase YrrM